jgi:hypothetical protein
MPAKKWSKEKVLATISALHARGAKLSSTYSQQHRGPLYNAACAYCGGWKQAIEEAGIPYEKVRISRPKRKVVWSKTIVIKKIRAMRRKKLPLNSNYIQKSHNKLYGAAYKYFGGWQQAIEASGLDYAKVRKMVLQSWSKQKVVDEVSRRFAAGLSIAGAIVSEENRGLYLAARRYLGKGGWAKARMLAGFTPVDPRPFKIWNKDTMRAEIQRLYTAGVPLNAGAMQESEYRYVLASARVVFGSWAKAIRAAGFDYSKIRQARPKGWWTKPRILMCIKSLEKRGVRLSYKSMRETHGALLATATLRFGSWGEAIEAAGISYRKHCRVWSTKAWLRRMDSKQMETLVTNARILAQRRR